MFGDQKAVKMICDYSVESVGESILNASDRHGFYPLHYCIASENLQLFNFLITEYEKHIKLAIFDKYHNSLLNVLNAQLWLGS